MVCIKFSAALYWQFLRLALITRLDRVLPCAAWIIGRILMLASVPVRGIALFAGSLLCNVRYRIAALVWHCLLGQVLTYLSSAALNLLWEAAESSALPIAGELLVCHPGISTGQCHVFSVVCPSVWNGLLWR